MDFLCKNTTVQKSQQNPSALKKKKNSKKKVSYISVDFAGFLESSFTTTLGDVFTAGIWDWIGIEEFWALPITRGVFSTALELEERHYKFILTTCREMSLAT